MYYIYYSMECIDDIMEILSIQMYYIYNSMEYIDDIMEWKYCPSRCTMSISLWNVLMILWKYWGLNINSA